MSSTQLIDAERPMTISSVSELLGIPVPTIRSWERRYGFPAPDRTRGRHRRYSTREVELLRALRDEITRGNPARDAVRLVTERAAAGGGSRTALLEDLLDATMRLDPTALRKALDDAGQTLGPERAIPEVLLPGMREIGSRWNAGTCDVAHEHLASEAVRVWLARLSAMAPPPFRGGTIVLACGPKDLHTIGLEAFGVLLARHGWGVRVLGSITPAASLVEAVRIAGAHAAVITSQRSVTRRAAVESIRLVSQIPGLAVFYAGDAFAAASARRGVPGTYLGTDMAEAVRIVERSLQSRSSRSRRSA